MTEWGGIPIILWNEIHIRTKGGQDMKGKIAVAVAMLMIFGSTAFVMGAEIDITGTFTPTASVSAELWNSTMAWGSMNVDDSVSLPTQINNTGTSNIDVTIKYKTVAGDLSLVASAPGHDEYRVEQNGTGSWTDVTVSYTTIVSDLTYTTGEKEFNVRLTLGSSLGGTYGEQTHDNTVQYVAHT